MKKYLFVIKAPLLLLLFLVASCQTDDSPPVYEQGTNAYTNQWIYQQMNKYYYWNQGMPGPGDLSIAPREYFKRLLHTDDRFSYALHPSLPETYPRNVRSSFGFDVSFVEHQGQVYGAILYVLSDSPAHYSILKRGMFLTAINGTPLDATNYETLYRDLAGTGQAQLQVVTYDDAGFSAPQQVNLSRGVVLLQPLKKHVITQGGNKTGYIEIPHFDRGLAQSLLQAFLEFKMESVNKIVIDLRYNGGGDISSATALCILLAPGIQPDDLFITFKGNNNGGILSQSFKQALEMNESQVDFQALRSGHMGLQKVYILCGSHTASASEIIINNLKPFMEVVAIGEKTAGKDVAGFAVQDERLPGQQGWILYPSIYKLSNAENEGDYSAGIPPAFEIDELQQARIFPLGDPDDLLFKKALSPSPANIQTDNNSPALHILPKLRGYSESDPLLLGNL